MHGEECCPITRSKLAKSKKAFTYDELIKVMFTVQSDDEDLRFGADGVYYKSLLDVSTKQRYRKTEDLINILNESAEKKNRVYCESTSRDT